MAWSDPVVWLLNAAIACGEDRTALAPDFLARAGDGFDRAEMQWHAAVTRRRLGALIQGDHGRELLRQSGEWMAAQDVRNPALLTRTLAPGSRATTPVTPCEDSRPPATATDHTGLRTDEANG